MGKFADRYFIIDPWHVREEGFDPAYGEVSESVFSLGNEYTGLRGYFDEGYSGVSLQGSYFNGLYERRMLPPSDYCGMLPYTDFMVNSVDWVYIRITCNGVKLDLATAKFSDFVREVDFRSGLLTRQFVWQVDDSTCVRVSFERFVSMEQEQFGGQKVSFTALEGTASLSIQAGLDFSRPHVSVGRSMFRVSQAGSDGSACIVQASTENTKQTVCASVKFCGMEGKALPYADGIIANQFEANLNAGESCRLERVAALVCARNAAEDATLSQRIAASCDALRSVRYGALLKESAAWWEKQWEISDISITGDDANQQGIRFCIFQLHQTLHTAKYGAVFGAKGLTGEAYNGNTFWDSEVYCLPFYLFNNPQAAKSILQFRYDTLPEARERAAALDCKGAFYPIATISGRECCDLWQHASLQLQASTGVAYGLWNYIHLTHDNNFLFHQGAELLVEISRMLASRGNFDSATGKYGYYCVMGPDEFQMLVHHNAYTNFMGKKTLEFTLETLTQMETEAPAALDTLKKALALDGGEITDWRLKAERMYIPYDEETKLFEQHQGFFHLPHLDIHSIPVSEFPLYGHWSYERIYRNDMLKQPDLLMFMMLYASEFTKEQLAANYDFYEPRCIHESSLSPSVHSILATRLGRIGVAEDFFAFATRMDLDNYNRNTREGLHTTSIAGAWMNIVYGFGGLCSDGDILALNPCIPAAWEGYSFQIQVQGKLLKVQVAQDGVTLSCADGAVELLLYGNPVTVTAQPIVCPLGK